MRRENRSCHDCRVRAFRELLKKADGWIPSAVSGIATGLIGAWLCLKMFL